MDFNLSEKMRIIIDMINEFVEKELIPIEPEFLTRSGSELLPKIRERQKMVWKGLRSMSPTRPKRSSE